MVICKLTITCHKDSGGAHSHKMAAPSPLNPTRVPQCRGWWGGGRWAATESGQLEQPGWMLASLPRWWGKHSTLVTVAFGQWAQGGGGQGTFVSSPWWWGKHSAPGHGLASRPEHVWASVLRRASGQWTRSSRPCRELLVHGFMCKATSLIS